VCTFEYSFEEKIFEQFDLPIEIIDFSKDELITIRRSDHEDRCVEKGRSSSS